MRQRIVHTDTIVHYYSKEKNGNGIFYKTEDFLVFYTLLSCAVRRRNMKILGFSIMFNHFHLAEYAHDINVSVRILSNVERSFTKEYNARYDRSGALFRTPLGCAPKSSRKRGLSSVTYVCNNPVAGKLHRTAGEYRWSLLAYPARRHPFSRLIKNRALTMPMQKALAIVNSYIRASRPLNYETLDRVFQNLDNTEEKQLTDHIVSAYNFLDYQALTRIYGSWDNVLTAFKVSAGDEFDFSEDNENFSLYRSMLKVASDNGCPPDCKRIESLSEERIRELSRRIYEATNAPSTMVRKFLRLRPAAQIRRQAHK